MKSSLGFLSIGCALMALAGPRAFPWMDGADSVLWYIAGWTAGLMFGFDKPLRTS